MKNEFEEIDALIKEALTEEEAKFYDNLDEQNIFEMLGGLFQGKNKWIILLLNVVMVVVFGALVYSVVQFFNTELTNELIKWSLAIVVCLLVVSMLKMFIWMQMDKNSIKREIKRIELQISTLSSKLTIG
jgi:cell division protein FtsL